MEKRRYKMDYEGAVCALNDIQSDEGVVAQTKNYLNNQDLRLQDMQRRLQATGLSVEDLDKLNVIHITGTKGKGSTCAFTERILRSYGYRTGFFSSPHLVQIRERIRINGQPISKELFKDNFWRIHKQLEDAEDVKNGCMPDTFQIMILVAFHVFLQEKVDVVILEVGIGGAYDSTNIIRKPWACGVTSLGVDHIDILGNTIEKIAWHKAGIFKPGVPAFSVSQPPSPLRVMQDRAEEIGCPMLVCPDLDDYEALSGPLCLGLAGEYQRLNASLALQLCNSWLQHKQAEMEGDDCFPAPIADDKDNSKAEAFELSCEMIQGVQETRWLGRSQKVNHGPLNYYIDGAHTIESIQACVDWFTKETAPDNRTNNDQGIKVLLFNTSGERDSAALLKLLLPCKFDYAVFCPNITEKTPDREIFWGCGDPFCEESALAYALQNQRNWQRLNGVETPCQFFPYILDALQWISQGRDPVLSSRDRGNNDILLQPADNAKVLKEAEHITVLVTGSLYLVGGVLEYLDPSLTA